MANHNYSFENNFVLENGKILTKPNIAYSTYGTLNAEKSNVIWVCHALTGNSDVYSWWDGLFGTDKLFNEKEHFIICANVLGSQYGTTGPQSIDPKTSDAYLHNFPLITIRDMVQMHIKLAEHLGIQNIETLIGGSLGGHQALEWSITQADRIQELILIASGAKISPWASAFSASQRMAIELDPSWKTNNQNAGIEGMKIARSIAMLSYRSSQIYNETQQSYHTQSIYADQAESYQKYQGEKLANRFNAFSYWFLSKAVDSHNVGRDRGGISLALQKVKARTLVIGIETDLLYPQEEQLTLVEKITGASYKSISSKFGHDGFLIETKKITQAIQNFIKEKRCLAVCA